MNNITCPYCNHPQEIDNSDGCGCTEDVIEEMECENPECEKTFTYMTSISFHYESRKADCLNGADHKYEKTHTAPACCTTWRCIDCGHEKSLDKDDPLLKIPIFPGGPLITDYPGAK